MVQNEDSPSKEYVCSSIYYLKLHENDKAMKVAPTAHTNNIKLPDQPNIRKDATKKYKNKIWGFDICGVK